eukprot:755054-Rhodomonas_salina.9
MSTAEIRAVRVRQKTRAHYALSGTELGRCGTRLGRERGSKGRALPTAVRSSQGRTRSVPAYATATRCPALV